MDNIVFYEPTSALSSQRPPLPAAFTTSNASGAPIASLLDRRTDSQLDQRNGIPKDHTTKPRNMSDLSQQRPFLNQRCRNDLIEEQDNGDNNDLPEIDKLLLGMIKKNDSACADPDSGDDDGFLDIDMLLSSVRQESITASAKTNSGGIAEIVGSGTRGGSLADSIRSTGGSSKDPIMLSDYEPVGAESEADYSDLNVGLRAKNVSVPPRVADSEPADDGYFSSGTTRIPGHLTADHPNDGCNNNGVVHDTQLRLSAACSGPASLCHRSITRPASTLRVHADITQGSKNYVDPDFTKELEDGECSVSPKKSNEDDDNTCSTERPKSSTVPSDNPAFRGNMSKLQDDQPNHAQSPQTGVAATSLHQSDLKNDHLPKHLRRRGATENVSRKRPRTAAPIRLVSTVSTVSAATGSVNLKEDQTRTLIPAPVRVQEPELHNIDIAMIDDGGTDYPSDRDSADKGGAAGSQIEGQPHSRKRARRIKDTNVAGLSAYALNAVSQAAAATSPGGMHESEEVPIHGCFTLKTIESKVVYCLTFSQELPPRRRDQGQRRDSTRDLESQSDAPVADANYQWGIREIVGQKMGGGQRHYRVKWEDTWMHESELAGAKELVDAFMVNGERRTGAGGRKQPATGPPVAGSEERSKKRRGRPRKQT